MRGVRAAVGTAVALAFGVACGAVEGTPRTQSPENACPEYPCESYAELVPGRGKPTCNSGRCEFLAQPTYPFRVLVHVPTSSQFYAGLTFQLTSEQLRQPVSGICSPPTCIPLRAFEATGRYRFTREAAQQVGMPLEDENVSVPVDVAFVPIVPAADDAEASGLGYPLDTTFASTSFRAPSPDATPELVYSAAIPPGAYVRYVYPQAPFDAYLPPIIETLPTVSTQVLASPQSDVRLGEGRRLVDDPEGTSRVAQVRRAEGLDRWTIWLADNRTQQRISTVRTLSGTQASVLLATSGQSASPEQSTALREDVSVVVAPPDDWVAVPRLVSTLLGGAGLSEIEFPPLPRPAQVTGLVAVPGTSPSAALAVPSRVSFRSIALLERSGRSSQLLRYETTVSTDATGLFATVLPPGRYAVTIEPDPVTRRGKVTQPDVLIDAVESVAVNLRAPPEQTLTRGRAVLSDGRPLADADVFASPAPSAAVPRRLRPRPARARTDAEGRFALSLDQGAYQIAVVPQEGSGFPRVVVLTAVGGQADLELPDVEVPAPVKLAFTLRNASGLAPLAHAVVRVFATLPDENAVEVGRAQSSADGQVEILLAREPR